jgi:hypothetical protein
MSDARMGRLLFLSLFALGGCKTTLPKEEPDAVFAPSPSPTRVTTEVPAASSIEPRPQPSNILLEPLQPVRGGVRVLPPYLGPDPCQMALAGESPVAQACSSRGKRGAIELMQAFVKRAMDEGFEFQCVDCHADEDDYTQLKPEADVEFRKLLFLARPD